MSRVQITVPVQLVKDEDGFWLQVEAVSKRSAAIHLDEVGGPLTSGILVEWASERMNEALLKRRRDTGRKDQQGMPILEGDILRGFYDITNPSAIAAVNYAPDLGAFVLSGVIDGVAWRSGNLRDACNWAVVGNVFQHAELLTPPAADSKAA